MLVDYKNRGLKIGQRVRIQEDIPSENGMLYKNSIVKLSEWNDTTKKMLLIASQLKVRIQYIMGEIMWVKKLMLRNISVN